MREGMDFPMAGVAVMVKRNRSGTIEQAKIVLGAVGPSPIEVPKAAPEAFMPDITTAWLQ